MSDSKILKVLAIGDSRGAVKAMKETGEAAEQAESKGEKFSKGLAVAAAAAGAALVALAGQAREWVSAASDLQQNMGALEATFGESTAQMTAWAEGAAQAVGLSQSEYAQLATVLGAQLKNMGVEASQLGEETNNLVSLGADLAAQYGGTTADAVAALSSLLRGERDPIERYGVSINQAAIDAYLAAQGLTELEGAAKTAAERQAVLALLTEQTSSAQGAFARESDTLAGQQQRLNAEYENWQAQMGQALLPVLQQLMPILSAVATWAQEHPQLVQGIVAALAILAVAILAIAAAQWVYNAAILANPITWIVIAIVAAVGILIAIIVLLIKNWDSVVENVSRGAEIVRQWIADRIGQAIQFFKDAIENMKRGAVAAWEAITAPIRTFVGWVQTAINWVSNLLSKANSVASIRLPFAAPLPLGADEAHIVHSLAREGGPLGMLAFAPATLPARFGARFPAAAATVVNITVTGNLDNRDAARRVRQALLDLGLADARRQPGDVVIV